MKNIMKALLSLAILSSEINSGISSQTRNFTPELPKKPIPSGCKEYHFEGFSCIASSQKSANKKHKKHILSSK